MRMSMNNKLTQMGRPIRRGAVVLAAAGLVVAVGAGIGDAENDAGDGRDPDAVPGAVTDAPTPDAATDGRPDGAAASSGGEAAAPSASGAVDNGRGAEPAVGPNPVSADASRSAAAAETGVDSDSGVAQVPDAEVSEASAPEALADEDVPGSDTPASSAGDADTASPGASSAPVDRDEP